MNKEKEIETVTLMVRRYCRGVHGTRGEALCPACAALLEYARQRRERCPHGDNKPFCPNCPIHCYKPEMRQQMCAVMLYAGPRMLLSNPILVLRHMAETMLRKRRNAHAG